MIERKRDIFLGEPTLVTEGYARLDCDCRVYVGVRVDTQEAATMNKACSKEHDSLMDDFNAALLGTLPNDSTEPLIEVCDDLLTKVAQDGAP